MREKVVLGSRPEGAGGARGVRGPGQTPTRGRGAESDGAVPVRSPPSDPGASLLMLGVQSSSQDPRARLSPLAPCAGARSSGHSLEGAGSSCAVRVGGGTVHAAAAGWHELDAWAQGEPQCWGKGAHAAPKRFDSFLKLRVVEILKTFSSS